MKTTYQDLKIGQDVAGYTLAEIDHKAKTALLKKGKTTLWHHIDGINSGVLWIINTFAPRTAPKIETKSNPKKPISKKGK